MSSSYIIISVAIMSAVTILLRFAPFVIFKNRTPAAVSYLGRVLPYGVMAMLVVYCLKSTDFAGSTHGIPEIISVLAVIALQAWKENTLISITAGTALYMVLVQLVFK